MARLKKVAKPINAERPQSIVLTSMQSAFVDATLVGKDPVDAASAAGYANPYKCANQIAKSAISQCAQFFEMMAMRLPCGSAKLFSQAAARLTWSST